MLHISHPNPWDLHQRDEHSKHLALKTNRAWIQENHMDVGNRDLLLNDLRADSLTLGPSTKATV